VITETVGVVWKDNLLVHAEALGYEDRARELLDAYESRADALGETLAADGELPEVSMVRFLPGSTRLYQKASFIGTILDDIGLRRPEAQDVEDFALEVSEEQVDLMDGDVIFHTHYGPVDETTAPAILDSPLWQSLDAVGAGEVHAVDDDHWMLGIGVGAAELVLDDLEATLLGEAATATGGEGSFPVEIDHAFGTTTIADAPERVVTWGWGSTDAAIALGVVPVAIPFEGYAGDDEGRLPWTTEAVEAAGSQQPAVLPQVSGDEIPLEAIAAADPDVILAHYSGITADDYALLSEIAPTVAYPDAPWTTPWREVIDVTGQALGRTAEAEAVLADIDAAVAEAAAAHPELDGLTVASVVDAAGTFYVYREADPRVAFLTDLGLEVDDSVSALASGESSFFYTLSYERLSELTSDVLVVYAEDAEAATAFLEESPTADMAQVREGRVAVVESAPLISSVSPPTAPAEVRGPVRRLTWRTAPGARARRRGGGRGTIG
jgi:iron complex transport system substrate-binding protein